ncbi:MAG TPA: DUF1573 domain-containing protein, partial [Bacteroidales bacterium]|nr:DUF1573 domain-containing protein [Bacteroidales bacterium]
MRHKNSVFILFLLLGSYSVYAQEKSSMEFAEKELNFGTIRAIDGKINHDFVFTNRGKTPIILNDVRTSCGCTVPEWPKEPILPGKTGKISVSFNPNGQSGSISKSIQIISNAVNSPVSLMIRGVVIPAERVEEIYKFTIGDLRLETIYAAFGEIYKGQTKKYTIRVFNTSTDKPAELTFDHVPAHLKIVSEPATVLPQQDGLIELEYNTALINTWDYSVDRINMLINGKAVQGNRISVTANIREDFSSLTAEQLAISAHVEFDSQQYDFGTIKADQVVEHVFVIKNTGKSNLYIRKVTAS